MEMTPLERAARAIYKFGDNGPYTLAEEDEQWHHHVDYARAVLWAIREPSEATIEAGGSRLFAGSKEKADALATETWQAMIDAALEEE